MTEKKLKEMKDKMKDSEYLTAATAVISKKLANAMMKEGK